MGQNNLEQQRRYMTIAYVCMFLALLCIVSAVISYWLARKVVYVENSEVWIHAQALWVMRSVIMFIVLTIFAVLWFTPLFFMPWDSVLWVKACTVIGVVFSAIAWLYLLNAWIKGFSKYMKSKAVF